MEIEIDNKFNVKEEVYRCDTCLLSDRNTEAFSHNTSVFNTLIKSLDINVNLFKSLQLCWECSARIKKFERFIKQALLALEETTQISSSLKTSPIFHQDIEPIVPNKKKKKAKKIAKKRHSSSSLTLSEVKKTKLENESLDFEFDIKNLSEDYFADVADDGISQDISEINTKAGYRTKDDKDNWNCLENSKPSSSQARRYTTYTMTDKEMLNARERERNRAPFLLYLYKCEECILSFPTEKQYGAHLAVNHVKKAGTVKCNTCGHYVKKDSLPKHCEQHLNLYICIFCSEKCSHDHTSYKDECKASFVNKKWIYKHCANHNFYRKKKQKLRALPETSEPILRRNKTDNQSTIYVMNDKEMELARMREKARAPYLKYPFQCEACVISYPRQCQYDEHMNQHVKGPKRMYCDICTRYVKEALYVPHREEHFKLYICNICAANCCSKHNNKQFEMECTASFVNHTWIGKHCLNEHRNETYTCEICGKISRKKIQHEVHVGRHTSYECPVCQKMIKGPHYLDRHIKNCHREWSWEDTYCAECDKQFKNSYVYREHLKTSKRHVKEQDMKYPCPHCPKKCAKSFDLREHINRVHIRIATFQCDRCDEKFVAKKQLETHIKKIHLNWKPPKDKICPICNKGFTASTTLKKHMYIHTGERPYKCELCPATFTQNGSMRTHHKLVHLKLRKVIKASKSTWEPKYPIYRSMDDPTTSNNYQQLTTTSRLALPTTEGGSY